MDIMPVPEVSYDLDSSQVARYVIALDSQRPEPDVTQLKLQKLLYLAQANYLAATGRRLFDDPVEAFDNGPVVYPVLREYSSYSRSVIAPDNTDWDPRRLPQDAREFIDRVWERYRDWTASALWRLTHDQAPWAEAYEPGAYRKQIPDAAMREYFRADVPASERVRHPSTLVVEQAFLDQLSDVEDDIVAKAIDSLK